MAGIVIIGAQAAGLAAAAQARSKNSSIPIQVIERSTDAATGICGLPFVVSGEITEARSVILHEPAELEKRYRLDLLLGHDAKEVLLSRRMIVCASARGDRIEVPFQRLIVATGARPHLPAGIPPERQERVFTLRQPADAERLQKFLRQERPRTVIVLGSGLLGLEMAEVFARRGLGVTVVEQDRQFAPFLPDSLAQPLMEHLTNQGITCYSGAVAVGMAVGNSGVDVSWPDGSHLNFDFIFPAVGVEANTAFLRELPLHLRSGGFIEVDQRMETHVPGIFAAGDCAAPLRFGTGAPAPCTSALHATMMGRAAGENAAGFHYELAPLVPSFCLRLFDWEVAGDGLSEKEAAAAGWPMTGVTVTVRTRPPYYPGPTSLWIHGTFRRDTAALVGCHVAGATGAAALIQVSIPMIRHGYTPADMLRQELPYTPPLGALWHPLHQLARVAQKQLN